MLLTLPTIADSPLHSSFKKMNTRGTYNDQGPKAKSTLERESFFAKFGQRIRDEIENTHGVAIQLSGGYRTRLGMAASISSGACSLVGLGRTVVMEPELPANKLLNPKVRDCDAVSGGWRFRGTWMLRWLPIPSGIKGSFALGWFYMQQRRVGRGYEADPELDMAWTTFHETITSWSLWFKSIVEQGPVHLSTLLTRVASGLSTSIVGLGQGRSGKIKVD
jgi:hypothetical protein